MTQFIPGRLEMLGQGTAPCASGGRHYEAPSDIHACALQFLLEAATDAPSLGPFRLKFDYRFSVMDCASSPVNSLSLTEGTDL